MGRLEVIRDLLFNPQLNLLEELQPASVLVALLMAALCGLIIFLVYRFFHKGAVYSESFNTLIVMSCVVTAFIIITLGTNLILTLGMVGALSIVRFRAAVKDPLDVGFLFWGVAAGLTAGARLYTVALIGTGFIAVLYILMTVARFDKRAFLLIVRYGEGADDAVTTQLNQLKYKLKNKTVGTGFTEITAEVKVKNNDTSFLEKFKETDNVENVVLVEFTGDYA